MFNEVRTRFAPSPTGYMHIGNLRTALYSYLIAKINSGKFILRIEDTDQERYVEGAIEAIYKTLRIAGLEYDEGPEVGGDYGPYIQRERKSIYKKYAEQLMDSGNAFKCFCTKERLSELREANLNAGVPHKYDGCCLKLSPEEIKARIAQGQSYVIRQKVPEQGISSFDDAVYGTVSIENHLIDHQILIKSDGWPTYNFANVIDDHLMQISHVVRGCEYLSSTPKYNLIYQSFGWDIPTYIHLPPVMKNSTEKLSKRNGDAAFEDLIKKGYLAEAILNYIVLLGWSSGTTKELFNLKELEKIFSIEGISKSPSIFDINKLKWLNGEYFRNMPLKQFHQYALPYYRDVINKFNLDLMAISELIQVRVNTLVEIPDQIDFFDKIPEYDVTLYVNKKMKCTLEGSFDILLKVRENLGQLLEFFWDCAQIRTCLMSLVDELGVKNSQVLWPVRVAVSGKQFTPGGAIEIVSILGKEEVLKRLDKAILKLKATVEIPEQREAGEM